MAIQDCKAVFGLSGIATGTRTNVSGSSVVGVGQRAIPFSAANVVYSVRAIFTDTGTMDINLLTGSTSGTTAFVAGTAQVETATIVAASGCTSNGTMALVLTAAGLTGSPLTVNVALNTVDHTTASLIAAAARTALEANTDVAAMFTIGGTGADITLTKKPTQTFTVGTESVPLYQANDATLNLEIPSGLGVTAAASSANTTAGVVTSGVKLFDGSGVDFEGKSLTPISILHGVVFQGLGPSYGDVSGSGNQWPIDNGGVVCFFSDGTTPLGISSELTITPSSPFEMVITAIGASA
jgi:hypothetical protein